MSQQMGAKIKKSYLTGVIFFCVFGLHTKGQSSAGAKADINLSKLLITQSANLKIKTRAGVSAGLFYKYAYRENAAIQADIMFRHRTSEIKNQTTGETADYTYFGVELPVYSLRQAEIDNQLLYFGIGAFASFGCFSRYQTDTRHINPYKEGRSGNQPVIRRWDFGAVLIIGYELPCRLQFNLNWQMGLHNMVNNGFENVEMISALVGISVGYLF
jgi:hypothetical protein